MLKKLLNKIKRWLEKPGQHHELRKFTLFKDLKDHELNLIFPSLHNREFKAGEILFEEGYPLEVIYFIVSGEVQLTDTPDIPVTMLLKKNQCLGVLELFVHNRRLGTAKALSNLQLLALSQVDFWEMVHKNTPLGVKLLTACNRILAHNFVDSKKVR